MKIYLDHIGIACENLDDSSSFWNLLGLIQGDDELVAELRKLPTRVTNQLMEDDGSINKAVEIISKSKTAGKRYSVDP